MTSRVAVLVGVLGLLFGSFASVAIHRWPRGGSVLVPTRSACPNCPTTIAARDNVPVVSWVLLRGRCRHCEHPISLRYPLVELLVGGLWAGLAAVHGAEWVLLPLLAFAWVLVVAAVIDLEHRIIPNRLTYRLPLVLLPLVVLAAALDGAWDDLLRAVIAGVGVPGIMFLLAELFRIVRGKMGLGMGDVKLAVSIGLVVGYLGGLELVVFAYATVLAAVVVAIALLVAGRARLASRIPFGPYLALGALVPILARDAATDLVRGLLGL